MPGYERLLTSNDPVRREIGEALRDGAPRRHLLTIPEYRAHLMGGLDRLRTGERDAPPWFDEESDGVGAELGWPAAS